jgi:branched-chain amino acid transport system substrate-binding protein
LTRPRPARPLALAAALTLALGVTACGADDSRSQGDAVLTVYVSAPLSGPGRAEGQDVADGARMALADAGDEAGGVEVRAEYLDVAGRNESRFDPVTAAANARTASEDSTTIAYVGELDSGASRTSTPILNEAGILQVAPGSGAEDLVRAGAVGNDVPLEVQPTGARTFARLVPSDGQVGGAIAGWIGREFGREEALVIAEGRYGREVADGVRDEAAAAGVDVTDSFSGRVAVVLAQTELTPPGAFDEQSRLDFPSDLIYPDAVLGFGDTPPRPVFVPTQLPAVGQDFAAAFADEYGRAPNRFAAYGYEAMASILAAVDRADDPLDRASVVGAYFDGTERDSVIGAYSVTDTGETTLGAMTGYELSPSGRLNPVAELNAP